MTNEKSKHSLYRRVLGENFNFLPEPLKNFHNSLSGNQAKGLFRVTRGNGLICRILCYFAGFPPSTIETPVHLEVEIVGEKEHWKRKFGDHKMNSMQWSRGFLLIEEFFPMRFAFCVVADKKGLSLHIHRSFFGPIPLPKFLNPRVIANEVGTEKGWNLFLRIEMPFLGLLVEYKGEVVCL